MIRELTLAGDYYHVGSNSYEAHWFKPDGSAMDSGAWNDPNTDAITLTVGTTDNSFDTEHWCFIINQHYKEVEFILPPPPLGYKWIEVVDTLTGSVGLGLITYLAAKRKAAGEKMDELIVWIEEHKLNICHFFVVDDLNLIQRSGRTSHLTAFVGTILGIKPIFRLDDNGKVDSNAKVRGKKAAIRHMIDQAKKKCADIKTFFICHGDVDDEAEAFKKQVETEFPGAEVVVNCVGPMLGINVGPGALALIFMGSER